MNKTQPNNIASLALGAVLLLAGLLFLVGQFVGARFWDLAWPFTILLPGLLLFVGMIAGGKSAGGLAIPASIVTTLGLLMLFQNTFNYFESWAYAWALIPTAVGVGMMINGFWSDRPQLVASGRNTERIGLIMFTIGFVFFEFVVRIGRFGPRMIGGFTGPLILIVIGGYLLFRSLAERSSGSNPQPRLSSPPVPTQTEPPKPVSQAAPITPKPDEQPSPPAPPPAANEASAVQVADAPSVRQEKDETVIM